MKLENVLDETSVLLKLHSAAESFLRGKQSEYLNCDSMFLWYKT